MKISSSISFSQTPFIRPHIIKNPTQLNKNHHEALTNTNQSVLNVLAEIRSLYAPTPEKELDAEIKQLLKSFYSIGSDIYYKFDEKNVRLSGKQAELIETVFDLASFILPSPAEVCDPQVNEEASQEKAAQTPFKLNTNSNPGLPLPNEVLQIIFSFIPYPNWQTVGKTAMVNKSFYNSMFSFFALNSIFQQKFNLFAEVPIKFSAQLLSISHFQPKKAELSELTDLDLYKLSRHAEKLEHLILKKGMFTSVALAEFLKKCPKLRSIEFDNFDCEDFDSLMAALSLYAPNLESLKIVDCFSMTDKSLFALTSHQKLCAFEYWNSLSNSELTDFGFLPFLTHRTSLASEFHTLKLAGCPSVTYIPIVLGIKSLNENNEARGKSLRHFCFSYCGLWNANLFIDLAQNTPNLQTLELGFSEENQNNEQASDILSNLLTNWTKLESIKINDYNYLTSDHLHVILASNTQSLKNLELYGNEQIKEIPKEIENCTELRRLVFERTSNRMPSNAFEGENFNSLSFQLDSLSLKNVRCNLNLSNNLRQVSLDFDERGSLEKLLDLKNLETLEIRIPSIDERILSPLTTNSPSLRKLSIISASSLSTDVLRSAARCKKLTHLVLSGLTLITPDQGQSQSDARYFTKHCFNVTHLGLPSCRLPIDQLRSLIKPYGSQLLSLDLTDSLLPVESLNRVLEDLTNLEALYLNQSEHISQLQLPSSLRYINLN